MRPERAPDVETELARLKGFQRRTVDCAFQRMYLDERPAHRFLVADEVGLGKTLVARGIIARAVDHLWDRVERVDVVYISSNIAIAQQNLDKLTIRGKARRATRLTLLPKELKDLGSRKLNFVAFTPGTSFDLKHKGGRVEERAVLYRLLNDCFEAPTALRNLLQCYASNPRWQRERNAVARPDALDASLSAKFRRELRRRENRALREEMADVLYEFRRKRRSWPDALQTARMAVIGRLRTLLAHVCIQALEPDLIILDEFQRFRDLLHGESPMSELAQDMWTYATPDNQKARVLLLSATPYRMYSTDSEAGGDDHYEDFIATTRFLMEDDESRVAQLKDRIRDYRQGIYRALHDEPSDVQAASEALRQDLSRVMVRTERVRATEDRSAMLRELHPATKLGAEDLRQWTFVDKLSEQLQTRDAISLWKSAPFLPQFMGVNYKLRRELDKNLDAPGVIEVIREHADGLLSARDIQHYREVDPSNARLRALSRELLEGGQHELLWVPPTMPYWELSGSFRRHADFTKSLVFSAWKVVPDVLSALLSYEAERLMLGKSTKGGYQNLHKRRRGLLRFGRSKGRLTGMTALVLQYPCLTLADEIDPVASFAAGHDPREDAMRTVKRLMRRLPRGDASRGDGRVDERWYWAAPALLDESQRPTRFINSWTLQAPSAHPGDERQSSDDTDKREQQTRFNEHVDYLCSVLEGETQLGPQPPDLAQVLVELALGAPGMLAARSLRPTHADDMARQNNAAIVAEGLRSLFNQPTAMAVVRRPEVPYWRATLQYAMDGGLAALIDEHFHQVNEQMNWQSLEPNERCAAVAQLMGHSATVKVSRITAQHISTTEDGVELNAMRLRTSYALRYGSVLGDKDTAIAREDAVRTAFNSPYRPFVLASTSIGQEGLDFHPWCHSVVHWNLPGNPVDLEQREGRVHRYKGHAVRKNVVASSSARDLSHAWQAGMDPWEILFARAAERRGPTAKDLSPWWICEGPHRVRRVVPMLPYSEEHERLRLLKRDLVAYRLVFGQPRQQELLDLVHDAGLSIEMIDRWTLDLSPRP